MKKRNTMRKLLRYLKKYWLLLILSLLFAALTVAMTLYLPILIGQAVDLIVAPGQVEFSTIARLLLKMGILIGATALSQWIMNACNNRITYRTVRDIRSDAFARLEILPLRYIDAHSYGEIVSRMIADVDQFADGLLMGFTQFFTGVLTIVGTLLFMLWMNPLITLVVVVITPVSLFVASFIARKTYAMFKEQSAARGEQTASSTRWSAIRRSCRLSAIRIAHRAALTRSTSGCASARCAPFSSRPSRIRPRALSTRSSMRASAWRARSAPCTAASPSAS